MLRMELLAFGGPFLEVEAGTMLVKIITVLVLVSHGLGHAMAPQSAFAPPGAFPRTASARIGSGLTIVSRPGKVLSLLWVVPLVGFLLGTYGLWTGQAWWRPVLAVSAVVSIAAALPWWGVMPRWSYLGLLMVDVLVLVGLVTPLGDQVVTSFGR